MKKTILSTVVACALVAPSLYAKKDELPAGKPFQQLNDMIEANEARITQNRNLIDANADAIQTNATSIQTLRTEVEKVSLALTAIEEKVELNSQNIAIALEGVEANKANIELNKRNLFELSLLLESSISSLNGDITSLRETTTTLSSNLSELQTNLANAVARLDEAIANNSADIAVLSALVSSTDAKLTLASAEILRVQDRVNALDATQATQENLILQVRDDLLNVSEQVDNIVINSNGGVSPTRGFTLTGTDADDYYQGEMRKKLFSLNYKANEYFYFKGENSRFNTEFCSNDSRIANAIMFYTSSVQALTPGLDAFGDSWIKVPYSSEWEIASKIQFQSYTQNYYNNYFLLRGYNENNQFAGIQLVDGRNYSQYFGYGRYNHYYYGTQEIYVNYMVDQANYPNSVTITVGSNRQEVCGF